MIVMLKLREVDVINGGWKCICSCYLDEEYEFHHKKKTHRVLRTVGAVDNAGDCSKICAILPNGQIFGCSLIDDPPPAVIQS